MYSVLLSFARLAFIDCRSIQEVHEPTKDVEIEICEIVNKVLFTISVRRPWAGYRWGVKPIRPNRDNEALLLQPLLHSFVSQASVLYYRYVKHCELSYSLRFSFCVIVF